MPILCVPVIYIRAVYSFAFILCSCSRFLSRLTNNLLTYWLFYVAPD